MAPPASMSASQWKDDASPPSRSPDASTDASPHDFDLDGLPSEDQLVLLCLDYLRDLRRSYTPEDLLEAENLDADYLSLAIYALSRSFTQLPLSRKNDPHFSMTVSKKQNEELVNEGVAPPPQPTEPRPDGLVVPPLEEIHKEILYLKNPGELKEESGEYDESKVPQEGEDDDATHWYQYDDFHVSNGHRFFPLNGLASGPMLRGPLTLGEFVASGLEGLGARSRGDAEEEMVQSPLFEQFLLAVESKGFFRDQNEEEQQDVDPYEDEETKAERATLLYQERYSKVVSKFRTKLAVKEAQQDVNEQGQPPLSGTLLALSAAERQDVRRRLRMDQVRENRNFEMTPQRSNRSPPHKQGMTPEEFTLAGASHAATAAFGSPSHPVDEQEAERLKTQGNAYMQSKQYGKAVESYTAALTLSPSGPNSHVYFSNRAAAHLSQRQIKQAVLDSERSLALKPDYAKAHSRLGLSNFLLGNYVESIDAYSTSLKYDPKNESSKRYLEKATKRVAQQKKQPKNGVKANSDEALEVNNAASQLVDEREAEKFKVKGNSYMASRNYQAALVAYSEAIKLCPEGHQSHVYYSNRAAALCYLERYEEAQRDSLCSLKLNPTYGKAHARLGLSRFFMGNYQGAVEAYTSALEFDPDNAASKSYLAKAKDRLRRQQLQKEASKRDEELFSASPAASRQEALSSNKVNHHRRRYNNNHQSKKQQEQPSFVERSDRFLQNRENMSMADPSMVEAMLLAQKETS